MTHRIESPRRRRITPLVVAASALLSAVAWAAPAWAQAPTQTLSAVAETPYVSGGIGKGEVKLIESKRANYNVHLIFSEGPQNDYAANVVLRIADRRGKTVLALDDAGPLTYVQLAPGRYSLSVRYGPNDRRQTLNVRPGVPLDLNLHFQREVAPLPPE